MKWWRYLILPILMVSLASCEATPTARVEMSPTALVETEPLSPLPTPVPSPPVPYPPPYPLPSPWPTPIPPRPTPHSIEELKDFVLFVFRERAGIPGHPLIQVTEFATDIDLAYSLHYVRWLAGGTYLEIGINDPFAPPCAPMVTCFTTVLIDLKTKDAWWLENQSCRLDWIWQAGGVFNMRAVSPDGRILALADAQGVWLIGVQAHTKHLLPGREPSLVFSPDGSQLAVVSGDGIDVVDPESGEILYHQPAVGKLMPTMAWSPSGDKLAHYEELQEECSFDDTNNEPEGSFRAAILDLATGTTIRSETVPTWLTDCIGEAFYTFSPQWLMNGEQLLLPAAGDLWLWDLQTGKQTVIAEDIPFWTVAVSPNRDQVLFSTATIGEKVRLYDVVTGQTTEVNWDADYLAWSPSGKELVLTERGKPGALLVSPETGEVITSYSMGIPLWSPDRHSVVFSFKDAIWLTDANGHSPRQIVLLPEMHFDHLDSDMAEQWSPSGGALAFLAAYEDEGYYLLEAYIVELGNLD